MDVGGLSGVQWPTSGLSSTTTSRARPTTGTDVLVCPPGSLLRASMSSGSASGTLRVLSTSGIRKHVPALGSSLLFLLSEELHRQPRAVYKFWAPCCAFSSSPRNWQSLIRCSFWFDSGYILRQSTVACGRCNSWTRCARTLLCNDRCRMSGHSCCVAEAVPHGPALLAPGAVLGQGCCCARCWSTTGAAVPQLQFLRSLTPLSLRSGTWTTTVSSP